MKSWYLGIVTLVFASSPVSAVACSVALCTSSGTELRSNFVVRVSRDNRPFVGVTVRLTRSDGTRIIEILSQETDANGLVRISKLPPGDYWLDAQLLDISAGMRCFHVAPRSSRKSKSQINFEWGDEAPAAREAAGKLVHLQAGQGKTPIWNLTHPVYVPLTGSRLSLRTPGSSVTYNTTSDSDGHFTFGKIPDGLYVLRVEGGTAAGGRSIEPANLLFRVSSSADKQTLFVDEADAFGGMCGGWSIEPDFTTGS